MIGDLHGVAVLAPAAGGVGDGVLMVLRIPNLNAAHRVGKFHIAPFNIGADNLGCGDSVHILCVDGNILTAAVCCYGVICRKGGYGHRSKHCNCKKYCK